MAATPAFPSGCRERTYAQKPQPARIPEPLSGRIDQTEHCTKTASLSPPFSRLTGMQTLAGTFLRVLARLAAICSCKFHMESREQGPAAGSEGAVVTAGSIWAPALPRNGSG